MESFKEFLNYSFQITNKIHIDVKNSIFIIVVVIATRLLLKLIRKLINSKLADEDKGKFKAIFLFYNILFTLLY